MKVSLILLSVGTAFVCDNANARILSRAEVNKMINALKSVNEVIENEVDSTRQRCRNQAARKTHIDETLAQFGTRATAINNQIASVSAERAPRLIALNNAKSVIAQKKSEISTLEGRIRNLGRDSDRESELRSELARKRQNKQNKVQEQIRKRSVFDQWEELGNNRRILNGALEKLAANPNAVLNANERAAVNYEREFNVADNSLTEEIQTLTARIGAIVTELANIAVADGRTLAQLQADKRTAENALREAERARDREIPQVAEFNREIRQHQARLALVTGLRPVEPINADCSLLLQTQ